MLSYIITLKPHSNSLTDHSKLKHSPKICKILINMHAHHWTHIDLKMDNVCVQPDGHDQVKATMIDFGLVTPFGHRLTFNGNCPQTYIAPEIRQELPVDGRADVCSLAYSMSADLYEEVTLLSNDPNTHLSLQRHLKLLVNWIVSALQTDRSCHGTLEDLLQIIKLLHPHLDLTPATSQSSTHKCRP